jgi:anthranilate phosphoribosyltransferase
MRERAVQVRATGPVVDTCGTGGDDSSTINISTAAAFVTAGAGVKVAKHGNRAMSSKCGSADVLEALGIKIDLTAEQVEKCLDEVGIGFMFAPSFHPAMKYAAGPRKELGIRTVFNILGPLTNPAGAKAQILGVADGSLTRKLAHVLQILGSEHALVVHGEDGLDEITITGRTDICELKNGAINRYSVTPENMGLRESNLDALKGGTAEENAASLLAILTGTRGPHRDVVLMNAAAALVAADKAPTLRQGVEMAGDAIDSGRASSKLDELVKFSQGLEQTE